MTNLMAIVHRAPVLTSRIGLAVSRKVGNAVHRNKVKRWIREASRRSYSLLSGAWDIVFIAHAGASDAGFDSISSEVRRVFQRVAEMKRS
jgi:ribonuclease P protein component